jgi:hypothetical protein
MPTLTDGIFSNRVHQCLNRLHLHTRDTLLPEPGLRVVQSRYSYNQFNDVFAASTKSIYRLVDNEISFAQHTVSFRYLPGEIPVSPVALVTPTPSPQPEVESIIINPAPPPTFLTPNELINFLSPRSPPHATEAQLGPIASPQASSTAYDDIASNPHEVVDPADLFPSATGSPWNVEAPIVEQGTVNNPIPIDVPFQQGFPTVPPNPAARTQVSSPSPSNEQRPFSPRPRQRRLRRLTPYHHRSPSSSSASNPNSSPRASTPSVVRELLDQAEQILTQREIEVASQLQRTAIFPDPPRSPESEEEEVELGRRQVEASRDFLRRQTHPGEYADSPF